MKRSWHPLAVLVLSLFAGTVVLPLGQVAEAEDASTRPRSPKVATIIKKAVATGSVVPRREVEIKPRVSGIIDEIASSRASVREGGRPRSRASASCPTW